VLEVVKAAKESWPARLNHKTETIQTKQIQLGLRTLPPSFPPQQLEISPTAPCKQIPQSLWDISGVHCTSAYTIFELLKLASPTANFRLELEACVTMLPIKLYSV
jgi:hypothetical protein